nr:alpha/beta fold hydrolase [Nocardioides immobilis]
MLGPSLGTSASSLWDACADLLSDDFEVLAWDLPGHGGEGTVATTDLTIPKLAACVLAQLDETFYYAGDSVGGAVGLQLMLDAPERVRSAVLLCTGARIGTPAGWLERIEQVSRHGTAALVEASTRRWFGPGFVNREPERAARLLDALRAAHDGGYVAVCTALARFDVRARLGEIATPVLAVAGSADSVTPTECLGDIADGVQNGRLVVLDGVAHLAPAEDPPGVADLIRRQFLEGTT